MSSTRGTIDHAPAPVGASEQPAVLGASGLAGGVAGLTGVDHRCLDHQRRGRRGR